LAKGFYTEAPSFFIPWKRLGTQKGGRFSSLKGAPHWAPFGTTFFGAYIREGMGKNLLGLWGEGGSL